MARSVAPISGELALQPALSSHSGMEHPSPKDDTRRKHVTTACVACREAKVKCNGATPACATCLSKGKECRYQVREDKRKLSLRVAIELLHARNYQLTQFLQDNGLEVPPIEPDADKVLSGILETLGLPGFQQMPHRHRVDNGSDTAHAAVAASHPNEGIQSPEDVQAGSHSIPAVPPPSSAQGSSAMGGLLQLANAANSMGGGMDNPEAWNWGMADRFSLQGTSIQPGYAPADSIPPGFAGNVLSPNQRQAMSAWAPSCAPLELEESNDSPQSVDDLADQLSDRMGTLHIRPGGHTRFYGPTSNFSLLEIPSSDVSMNVHRTIRNDGTEHLDRLGLNKKFPSNIEDHLMVLYFTWQDPAFHVVDRKMFEDAKASWHDQMEDTAYYSEALRNAICALGAAFESRHHPDFVTFPRSLADFFADRAKALLEIELDSPSVATIQALILLSAHDIGCARDARGWLFSGMATRLSFNLALHQDLKPYVAKGVVTTAEANLRKTVFWAAFIVDHVWSLYLGQPFRMSAKGVTLDKPGVTSGQNLRNNWVPYVSPTAVQSFTPMPDRIEEVCRYQVLLFETMAYFNDTLYGSMSHSRNALQELNTQTIRKLVDWKENLPAELNVDINNHEAAYLPHVILLHMQYHQGLIYAHRPWMSKSHHMAHPTQGPGAAHARKMCMDSASSIARLLRLYEERYTLRRINIQAVAIIFSAALLLVFATVSHYQREREDEILGDLSVCFRALDDLAPAWDTAKRAREFLTRLQRHWERQAKTAARENAVSAGPDYTNPRKRSRASVRPPDENVPPHLRSDCSSSLGVDYMSDSNGLVDFGMDLDFDWMLRTSMEGMSGNWGNIFSVPSRSFLPD